MSQRSRFSLSAKEEILMLIEGAFENLNIPREEKILPGITIHIDQELRKRILERTEEECRAALDFFVAYFKRRDLRLPSG